MPLIVIMIHSYYHIPLLMSGLDISMGLNHLLQWKASVDHRFELTRLCKVQHEHKIIVAYLGYTIIY